jgi:cytochrome c553
MRHGYAAVAALVLAATATTAQQPEKLPIWAYPGHFSSSPVTGTEVEHLPGSKASYTRADINQIWVVPDWYPDGHPPMPEVVAHGRKPDVYSCGHCHLPNGQGRPENASVAGLPAAYIIEQMADFKNGLRKASDPEMLSVTHMVSLAKSTSDDDVKAAAAYFSSIPLKPWIRVLEVDHVRVANSPS